MMDLLRLTDFTPVGKENVEFCKALQASLRKDFSGVIGPSWEDLSDEDGEEDERDRKSRTATVFHTYRERYSTYKYAGMLHYQGRTVQISSRFDDSNQLLSYTLEKAGQLPVTLLRSMQLSVGTGKYRRLLAYLFLRQLKEAYALGVYRQYRTFSYNDSRPRGHLDLSRHIRLNPMENGKIAYSVREYTADNAVNRLILIAWQALREDQETAETVEKLLRGDPTLREAPDGLSREIGEQKGNFMARQKLLQAASRPIAHPMHQRYEQVRRTAILILRQLGYELFADGNQSVTGFLFPMDRIWELFLQTAVLPPPRWDPQNKIQILLPAVHPAPGEKQEGLRWSGEGRRELKPDFLLDYDREKGTSPVVLDAKYKTAWAQTENSRGGRWSSWVREDVFQMIAYMAVTGAEAGGVVYPARDQREERWLEHPELAERYMEELRTRHVHRLHAGDARRFYTIPIRLPRGGGLEDYRKELDFRCACYRKALEALFFQEIKP